MFVGLSTLDDLDAPPLSASNRCIQTPPAHRSAPRGLGDHGDGGGPKLAPLQRRPDPAVFAGGAGGEARRVVQTKQDRGETHSTPFGSTQESWNTRLVLGEGREASSCRVNYRTDAGALFWIRSVKGAVRSIGRGADILRIGIRSAGFYALDARRTCRTKVKALGCDRDACANGYQIRQCQPRASGLRRT
jgi:hypothetical protein